MKQRLVATTVLVGLMGCAGLAMAQGTTAMPAQPDPAVAGQASTKTPAGVANPTQRPDGSNPASREMVKSEARIHNRSNAPVTRPERSTGQQNRTANKNEGRTATSSPCAFRVVALEGAGLASRPKGGPGRVQVVE